MKAREAFAAGRYDEALETVREALRGDAEPGLPAQHRPLPAEAATARQGDRRVPRVPRQGARRSPPTSAGEINGYIKEMEALRDEQAAKQQPRRRRPWRPSSRSSRRSPRGRRPVTRPSRPRAYPGTQGGRRATRPGADQQQPSGALVAQPAQPQPASSGPVYTKWWFWTIVGAVVVGGVVTAVALSSGTSKPDCPAGVCCCP